MIIGTFFLSGSRINACAPGNFLIKNTLRIILFLRAIELSAMIVLLISCLTTL